MELAIYDAFRKAGVEEEAAKAIAANLNANFNTTVSKAIEQSVDLKQLATKSDIEHHYAVHSQQLATKGDVEKLRLDVEKLRIETKADIEKVRLETKADIEKAKAEIIKWNIGAIIAAAGIAMAIARLFFTA